MSEAQNTFPKPRMLIVSHVLPFPRAAGQQQRVYNKLSALRELFEIDFLTFSPPETRIEIERELSNYCDRTLVLPSIYAKNSVSKLRYSTKGFIYNLKNGLKLSNYIIGSVEFNSRRLVKVLNNENYHCVLYEYWHASKSVQVFQKKGALCVLDMHDILWKSYQQQLSTRRFIPTYWKTWATSQYQEQEEAAWGKYDAIIAINKDEYAYTRKIVGDEKRMFYSPMGTDLNKWPYCWSPTEPPRVAYYGGLGSPHNQRDALYCFEKIMPSIWGEHPETELWLVGSNPPEYLYDLKKSDRRIRVTGYVDDVQDILKKMHLVLCPWTGRYGFRSRLIEVMALGVPVIASPDAVYGMDLIEGQGLLLSTEAEQFAAKASSLLNNIEYASEQSRMAREQVERSFSFENTYGKLAQDLYEWVRETRSNPV